MDKSFVETLEDNSLIVGRDVAYEGTLRKIKKSKTPFQAVWEAITNSFESIRELHDSSNVGCVNIRFYYTTDLLPSVVSFSRVEIEDSGIGFNNNNFERFLRINDDSKSARNRGSGRIQLLHTFQKTFYSSIFSASDGNFYKREFVFSKTRDFLIHNAIVRYLSTNISNAKHSSTLLICTKLFESNESEYLYENINAIEFKRILQEHYLPFFCSFKTSIPRINIQFYKDEIIDSEAKFDSSELPNEDKSFPMAIHYTRYNKSNRTIEKLSETEQFLVRCFKVGKNVLIKNKISIVCKDEVVPDIKIDFDLLKEVDTIDGNRYLLFVSGPYFDKIAGETRGELFLPIEKEIKQDDTLCDEKVILLDDIRKHTNHVFKMEYPEILKKEQEYLSNLEQLRKMFLLNETYVKRLLADVGINTTVEAFLKKVYTLDSEQAAKVDAEIKSNIDALETLDPTQDDYPNKLREIIYSVVKTVPLQNRTDITHYVARRKLVLELFDKALKYQLQMQNNAPRKIDEKILHNILFQQSSKSPEDSDLWLINEDFIYFRGASEHKLCDVTISNQKLFKDEFSDEEEKYLHSLGEDRTIKRPDVLLFPEEGKCIIVEFKSPNVNIAKHLNQINMYAALILQFSSEKFPINLFFGYLIGEDFSERDIRMYDGDFKRAYQFDYLFRPAKIIPGENRADGSLYTEVIKYSTLLERAKRRNEIFIKRLTTIEVN